MSDVVVVGAGISGAACARVCADAGVSVRLLDRAHRAGGRMATRTLRDLPEAAVHPADTGAPYFTVSDDGFRQVVDGWLAQGLAREWTDTFRTAGPRGLGDPKPGPMRYASTAGLRALVEDLADGIDLHRGAEIEALGVHRRIDGESPEVVVLAMPGPQAARVLARHHGGLAAVADQQYDPTIALVARFAERAWPEFDGAFVSDVAEVRWVADDGRSRGDGAPVLVAHSTPDFARQHLEDPEAAAPHLVRALRTAIGVRADPVQTVVQRWTFAQPTGAREATFHLGLDGIGLCSDGWSQKSKVEAAWRSGTDLGAAVVARLT